MNTVQSQLHTKKFGKRGFTLFEVIISLAIFTILTSTVLLRHSRFKGDILITNLATQIALSVREAQVNSLSVKGQVGSYTYGYGVYFNKNEPEEYVQFVDLNNNGRYDSASDTLMETVRLPKGNTISKLCAFYGLPAAGAEGAANCSSVDASSPIHSVTLTFKRPNPNAYVIYQNSVGVVTVRQNARIYVRSSNDHEKQVLITHLGLITVEE